MAKPAILAVDDDAAVVARIVHENNNPGELNQVWTNLIDNAVDAGSAYRSAADPTRTMQG